MHNYINVYLILNIYLFGIDLVTKLYYNNIINKTKFKI